MARIVVMTAAIESGASHTAGVNLGDGEFNRFAIEFPSTNPLTASADITAQQSTDGGTTWSTIGYSNNPSTATSGFEQWDTGADSWGTTVICEAALFAKDFRLKFATAATSASEVKILLGKD